MRSHSHRADAAAASTPFTLTLDDANQHASTGRISVSDTSGSVPPVPLEPLWASEARAHATRYVAHNLPVRRRRTEPPLSTLQPPPLRFTERSLPEDNIGSLGGGSSSSARTSPQFVRRPARTNPFSAAAAADMRELVARELCRRSSGKATAVPASSRRSASTSAAGRRSSSVAPPVSRRSRPHTAAFVPVGEMTSPTEMQFRSSRAPVLTSPVRAASSAQPSPVRPFAAAALLSPARSFGSDGGGFLHAQSHGALAAASSPSQAAPAASSSPKVDWTLEQWKAWAETPNVPAAGASAAAAAIRLSAIAATDVPRSASEQLLYPASVLLTPPRARAISEARNSSLATPEASPIPPVAFGAQPMPTAASSASASAAFPVAPAAVSSAALFSSTLPPFDSAASAIPAASATAASFAASAAASMPALFSPSSVAAKQQQQQLQRSPSGMASPPPSTIHAIGVQALRNLHARLLITNTFAAWKSEYRRRDKLERMRVFIIGDQYDRNFLLQHFGGWLRVWLERVSARAEAAAFARAESHRDRRALRHAFARLLQAACNAQEKRQQTEQLWEKKGHTLHATHKSRAIMRHWFSMTEHYKQQHSMAVSLHARRTRRAILFPWLRASTLSAVLRLFQRRVLLRRQWAGWRAVFRRQTEARGLEHALRVRQRGRIFFAWHQLLERNFLLKQYTYGLWRRLFQLHRNVCQWRHRRAMIAWRAAVSLRKDEVARGLQASSQRFEPRENRRRIAEAWLHWRHEAEYRFEQNLLRSMDEFRATKQRRRALALWQAYVARHQRVLSHLRMALGFQQRQQRRVAARRWMDFVQAKKEQRARLVDAAEFHRKKRCGAFVLRWRIFKNDAQLLAHRTSLLHLFQMRPFLRTLRLHTQFAQYVRRMRHVAEGYSIRRLGGVLFDEWRGRGEAYRTERRGIRSMTASAATSAGAGGGVATAGHGYQYPMPTSFWKEPGGATTYTANAMLPSVPTSSDSGQQAPQAAAATLPSGHITKDSLAFSRSMANTLPSDDDVQPPGNFSHMRRPRDSPLYPSALASSLPARERRQPQDATQSSPLRRSPSHPHRSPSKITASPASQPAPRSHSSPADKLPRPPREDVFFSPTSQGQVHPLDHAVSISAFPRSDFAAGALPLGRSSALVLEAVQGLPSHGLPRPEGVIVPPVWQLSDAREYLLRDTTRMEEPRMPLKFTRPLPPVAFEPAVKLPSSSAQAADADRELTATERSSAAAVAAVASPSASPARPVAPLCFASTSTLGVVPVPVLQRAGMGSTSSSDPSEQQRRNNRQKLERMLAVTSMPASEFYRRKREGARPLDQRPVLDGSLLDAMQTHEGPNGLHPAGDRAAGTGGDATATALLESNYRNQELSRLHYQLNLQRRFLLAWHAERGVHRRCLPLRERIEARMLHEAFVGWTRAQTDNLKVKLVQTRRAYHCQMHALRHWFALKHARREWLQQAEELLRNYADRRLAERCLSSWRLGYLTALQERTLVRQAKAERKVGLLGLMASFVPERNARVASRVLAAWHKCMMKVRGERLREERLQRLCVQFQRTTLTPHLCRPALRLWQLRLYERRRLKSSLKQLLIETAFRRTLAYRTFHFLRVLSPLFARIQQREQVRACLRLKWRNQVRFHKARRIMRRVNDTFERRDALWRWVHEVRRQVAQEKWDAALLDLQRRVRCRLVRPAWTQWSTLSSELLRVRLHETLLQSVRESHRLQRLATRFYAWHELFARTRAERLASQKAAAKAARRNQMYLSLQVAHLCHKFALLRRMWRQWTVAQAASIDARKIRLPIVPVFADEHGVLMHTDVRPEAAIAAGAQEVALPYGILYQPFLVSPAPPPPPPPRSPLRLLPSSMELDMRSPAKLSNMVAPPERTAEEVARLRQARREAASTPVASPAKLPRPEVEDEKAEESVHPTATPARAGLRMSDLLQSPAKTLGAIPIQPAPTSQPVASAFPAAAATVGIMGGGGAELAGDSSFHAVSTDAQSEMLWHTAPQQLTHPPHPQASQQPATSSSSLQPLPKLDDEPSLQAASPSVVPVTVMDASLHASALGSPAAPRRLHVSFRDEHRSDEDVVSTATISVTDTSASGQAGSAAREPQFLGFALPFAERPLAPQDLDGSASAYHQQHAAFHAAADAGMRSPPVRQRYRHGVPGVYVPLRSVLSSPEEEDENEPPRRFQPRSRFAAPTAKQQQQLLQRRMMDAARSNSYAAIHASQQAASTAGGPRVKRIVAAGGVYEPARSASAAAAAPRSLPSPEDSLLHQAFAQQRSAAAEQRNKTAKQQADAELRRQTSKPARAKAFARLQKA